MPAAVREATMRNLFQKTVPLQRMGGRRSDHAHGSDDALRPPGHRVADLIEKYAPFVEKPTPKSRAARPPRPKPFTCDQKPGRRFDAADIAEMCGIQRRSVANFECQHRAKGRDHFIIRGLTFRRVAWARPDSSKYASSIQKVA